MIGSPIRLHFRFKSLGFGFGRLWGSMGIEHTGRDVHV